MTDERETKCPACRGTGDDPRHTWGNGGLPKPGMGGGGPRPAGGWAAVSEHTELLESCRELLEIEFRYPECTDDCECILHPLEEQLPVILRKLDAYDELVAACEGAAAMAAHVRDSFMSARAAIAATEIVDILAPAIAKARGEQP